MFDDIRLGTKLIGGFIVIALISTIIGATSLINMHKMAQADKRLYDDSTVPLPELSRIGVSFQGMRIASRDFINAQSDASKRATFEEQIHQRGNDLTDAAESYKKRNLSPEMVQIFADFIQTHKNYETYLSQIVALAKAGKDKEAWEILWSEGYNNTAGKELSLINRMEELKVEEAKKASEQNNSLASTSVFEVGSAIIAGLVFAIGLGLWLTHSITGRVRQTASVLAAVADGDLTKRLDDAGRDEVGQMSEALNRTLDQISHAMQNI